MPEPGAARAKPSPSVAEEAKNVPAYRYKQKFRRILCAVSIHQFGIANSKSQNNKEAIFDESKD